MFQRIASSFLGFLAMIGLFSDRNRAPALDPSQSLEGPRSGRAYLPRHGARVRRCYALPAIPGGYGTPAYDALVRGLDLKHGRTRGVIAQAKRDRKALKRAMDAARSFLGARTARERIEGAAS